MNLTLTRKEVNCYWSVVMSGRDHVGSRIWGFRLMMEARNRKQETGSKKQEARNRKQEATTFNSHLSLGRPGDRN